MTKGIKEGPLGTKKQEGAVEGPEFVRRKRFRAKGAEFRLTWPARKAASSTREREGGGTKTPDD